MMTQPEEQLGGVTEACFHVVGPNMINNLIKCVFSCWSINSGERKLPLNIMENKKLWKS
jgi:hypothetical protein